MIDIKLKVMDECKEEDINNIEYNKRLQKSFNDTQLELVERRFLIQALVNCLNDIIKHGEVVKGNSDIKPTFMFIAEHGLERAKNIYETDSI